MLFNRFSKICSKNFSNVSQMFSNTGSSEIKLIQLSKLSPQLKSEKQNAVKNVYNDIKENKNNNCTILFSPAAASYDQFKNFEDRGNQFKALIKRKAKIFYYV